MSGGATADGRGIVGSLRHQVRGAQGETPDLGLPDRMTMALYRFPFWGIVLEQVLAGGMVERCFISHFDGGGDRWHGAVETRRPMCDEGLAQEDDVVWRHGGVDGRVA